MTEEELFKIRIKAQLLMPELMERNSSSNDLRVFLAHLMATAVVCDTNTFKKPIKESLIEAKNLLEREVALIEKSRCEMVKKGVLK